AGAPVGWSPSQRPAGTISSPPHVGQRRIGITVNIDHSELTHRLHALGAQLKAPEVELLVPMLAVRQAAAGEVLIAEDTPSSAAYLLWKGRVSVRVKVGAEQVEVGHLEEGTLIGEVTYIDDGPATATIVAVEPCTVLVFPHG